MVRGCSTLTGKDVMMGYFIRNIPMDAKILDAGFGGGTIGRFLKQYGYKNVDGLDVYDKELEGLCLQNVYRNIFFCDMRTFEYDNYDTIIFGDSLEHISLEDAKKLLERLIDKVNNIVISVPYMQPMKSVSDNPHDEHLQPTINREYMKENYPYLELLYEDEMKDYKGIIGVYVWSK